MALSLVRDQAPRLWRGPDMTKGWWVGGVVSLPLGQAAYS